MAAPISVVPQIVSRVSAAFDRKHYGLVAVLARLVLGLAGAHTVNLSALAQEVVDDGCPCHAASVERQFRRWLHNDHVALEVWWSEITPALLATVTTSEVLLVVDPTALGKRWTVVTVGVAWHDRVLPLAGRVLPQQTAWGSTLAQLLHPAVARIAAAVPPDRSVTLLADQGLTGPSLLDLCAAVGWHFVGRVNALAAPDTRVLTRDLASHRIADLLPRRSYRRTQQVVIEAALYRASGWRWGIMTIYWRRDCATPWVLFSETFAGAAAVDRYDQRWRIEATFQDLKRRGWDLEASHLRDAATLERLLFALFLTYWWLSALGQRAIHNGHRRRYDRACHRSMAVVKLGQAVWQAARDRHRIPRWFEQLAIPPRQASP